MRKPRGTNCFIKPTEQEQRINLDWDGRNLKSIKNVSNSLTTSVGLEDGQTPTHETNRFR